MIAKDLGVNQMVVYNDSSVVVGQILGHNMVKEDHMVAYLTKAKTTAQKFRNVILIQVPGAQNNKVDCLAKLASSKEMPKGVHIEYLERKSIEEPEEVEIALMQVCRCWINPILHFLRYGTLPED